MDKKPNRTRLYIKDKNGEWKEVQRVKEERTPGPPIPGLADFTLTVGTFYDVDPPDAPLQLPPRVQAFLETL